MISQLTLAQECQPRHCATDQACASGEVCTAGACVAPPAGSAADACQVFPAFVATRTGLTETFHVRATAQGAPLNLGASAFTWSATAGVQSLGGGAFSGSAAALSTVQATVNGHACTAQLQVLALPTAALSVTVVDRLTGRLLDGATVQVQGAAATHTTASGATTFSAADLGAGAGGPYTVSVFKAGYGYLTVVGTRQTDLRLEIERNPRELRGGFQGSIDHLDDGNPDFHLVQMGTSLPLDLTRLTMHDILGPAMTTPFSIGSTQAEVTLGDALELGLSTNIFKGHFGVSLVGNGCSDAAQSAAGTCGQRSVWGLGGSFPISKFPISQLAQGGLSFADDLAPMLVVLGPVLRGFHSIVAADQRFTPGATLPDGGADPVYLSAIHADLAVPPAVAMDIPLVLRVPALPSLGGVPVGEVLVLGGAALAGDGLVPLTWAAGADVGPLNGVADGHVEDFNGVHDQLQLGLAPAHAGAEGSPYVLLSMAGDRPGLTSTSVVVSRPEACVAGHTDGLCWGGTIDPGAAFLGFAEGSGFDYMTRAFTAAPVAGASWGRVVFTDGRGRRWEVLFDGSAAFTLPQQPSGFEDRSRADGAAQRSAYEVQALDTGFTLDAAATWGAGNAAGAGAVARRYSDLQVLPPTIAFETAAGTIPSGGTVTVDLAHDEVNGNAWRLCATSGPAPVSTVAGCVVGPTILTNGRTTATLPPSFSGSLVLHAVLVDRQGALLAPTVEAALAVTVQ